MTPVTPAAAPAGRDDAAAALALRQPTRFVITTDELRGHIHRFRINARRARLQLIAQLNEQLAEPTIQAIQERVRMRAQSTSDRTSDRTSESKLRDVLERVKLMRLRRVNAAQSEKIDELRGQLADSAAQFQRQMAALQRRLNAKERDAESKRRACDVLRNDIQNQRRLIDTLQRELGYDQEGSPAVRADRDDEGF